MLEAYKTMRFNMSLKMNFLHSQCKSCAVREEHGEIIQQDIAVMEKTVTGKLESIDVGRLELDA